MATTISISRELKEKIRDLGKTGETYEEVIERMYNVAIKNILMTYLYDESDSVSIDKAIERANKKWPE